MPPAACAVNVREALKQAVDALASAGVETPRLDSEMLLAHVLETGREQLVLSADSDLDPSLLARFEELVSRRVAREPVAYILGHRPFRHIELEVDPRVLVPRPETELLVEAGLTLPRGQRVVDVGTGSGAVALALKQERPDLVVVGIDISPDALEVARLNAARLGLDVSFVCGDLLEPVEGTMDAALGNLPYVPDGADLAPEITRYEPRGALFAGADGLAQIRRLVRSLDGVPTVALEVGFDQAVAVSALLSDAGYRSVERLRDLAGHERVVVGRR